MAQVLLRPLSFREEGSSGMIPMVRATNGEGARDILPPWYSALWQMILRLLLIISLFHGIIGRMVLWYN